LIRPRNPLRKPASYGGCRAHQPSLAKRVKAAAPKPTWAKAGAPRELRLGKPRFPAARATRSLAPTKISKTTPCKVATGRCFERSRERFDRSGKSAALLHRRISLLRFSGHHTTAPLLDLTMASLLIVDSAALSRHESKAAASQGASAAAIRQLALVAAGARRQQDPAFQSLR
jgi:hypothetical protein